MRFTIAIVDQLSLERLICAIPLSPRVVMVMLTVITMVFEDGDGDG